MTSAHPGLPAARILTWFSKDPTPWMPPVRTFPCAGPTLLLGCKSSAVWGFIMSLPCGRGQDTHGHILSKVLLTFNKGQNSFFFNTTKV